MSSGGVFGQHNFVRGEISHGIALSILSLIVWCLRCGSIIWLLFILSECKDERHWQGVRAIQQAEAVRLIHGR